MTFLLKPNPDKTVNGEPLKVWDPERNLWLPAEGAGVPSNSYWVRRIADGDCVVINSIAAATVEDVAEAPLEEEEIVEYDPSSDDVAPTEYVEEETAAAAPKASKKKKI